MDVDNFLNTQLNTFHTNRNIEINAIDNNIEHLPNTDILDIITGDVFSFATHNVRGMNDDIKCKQIIDTFRIKKTDFISLTETHHKSSMFFKYKKDPDFVSFWSKPDPNDSPAAGVGLLINKKWSRFITKSFLDNNRFIYIDLFLNGHVKLRVFSLYIHTSPSNPQDKHNRRILQKQLLHIIDDSIREHYHVIFMGDFNTDIDDFNRLLYSGKSSGWKFDFIKGLFQKNFLDLHDISNDNPKPTFIPSYSDKHKTTPKRLDGIFASSEFISDFIYCGIAKSFLYKSDHKMLIAHFAEVKIEKNARARRNNTKRKVLTFSLMDQEKWTKFSEQTDLYFQNNSLNLLIDLPSNRANMNKLWEAIRNGITQVASRIIPYKWITSYDNAPKPK